MIHTVHLHMYTYPYIYIYMILWYCLMYLDLASTHTSLRCLVKTRPHLGHLSLRNRELGFKPFATGISIVMGDPQSNLWLVYAMENPAQKNGWFRKFRGTAISGNPSLGSNMIDPWKTIAIPAIAFGARLDDQHHLLVGGNPFPKTMLLVGFNIKTQIY